MDLSSVYSKIQGLGITLMNTKNDISAMSIVIKDKYGIFINYNKFKNSNEEFNALAHEYGHCATGSLHRINSPFDIIAKHENIANRRAVEEFLPVCELKRAAKHGCQYAYEIAEYLGVPEQFVKQAIDIYKQTGELQ